MKKIAYIGLVLVAWTTDMVAQDYKPFLSVDELPEPSVILAPCPAEGTTAFALDVERYNWGKGLRESPRGAQAIADADISTPDAIFTLFKNVVDVEISEEKTPEVATLLLRAYQDIEMGITAAKAVRFRTRPFVYYNEHTSVPTDEDKLRNQSAYPSGHTMIGWCLALLLSEIDVEHQSQILERGIEVGISRVITGYHWQSDVDNARNVGTSIVIRLHADHDFCEQMAKAKQEFNNLRTRH